VKNIAKNNDLIWFWGILFLGGILRLLFVLNVPFVQDEVDNIYVANDLMVSVKNFSFPLEHEYFHHPLLALYGTGMFIKVFGENLFGCRFFNFLTGLLTLVFLFNFMTRCFNRKAAVMAMFLLAVNPYHIAHTSQARMTGPLMMFIVLGLIILAKASEENRWWQWILGGLVMGGAYYCKDVALIFIPVVFLWLILFPKTTYREAIKNFSLWVVSFGIIILPLSTDRLSKFWIRLFLLFK